MILFYCHSLPKWLKNILSGHWQNTHDWNYPQILIKSENLKWIIFGSEASKEIWLWKSTWQFDQYDLWVLRCYGSTATHGPWRISKWILTTWKFIFVRFPYLSHFNLFCCTIIIAPPPSLSHLPHSRATSVSSEISPGRFYLDLSERN